MNLRDRKYEYIKLWMQDITLTNGIIFNISDSKTYGMKLHNYPKVSVIENHQYTNGHY